MLLEDARLMGKDIFLVMVDLKEAFDTIDHERMYKILTDLGYPDDAVQVVQGLYKNAHTQVVTPFGRTDLIKVQRGTLQGDGLSPFLFILYLEPLLRWLNVGARGYHPGVFKETNQPTRISNTSYADDLTLYTEGHSNMTNQTDKVSKYSTWAGLIISQPKTLASAALYKRQPDNPMDYPLVQRLVANFNMQGEPVTAHDPKTPYKLLGVWYTMDLRWKKQFQETCKALREMASNLAKCYNSQSQKIRTLQTCLKAKARYAFPMMCYSDREIEALDRALDLVVRKAYGLPPGTPTAMIREDLNKGGLGNTSLKVAYTASAIKNLTQAHADQGNRGQLTRALLAAQLQAFTHPSAKKGSWVPDYSLRLRQLIQGTKADIYMWRDGTQPYQLPDSEVAQTIMGTHEGEDTTMRLYKIKKPLMRLQEVGVLSLSQLLNRQGTKVLNHQELKMSLGINASLPSKYKKALTKVTQFLANPKGVMSLTDSPTYRAGLQDTTIHSDHAGWIRKTLRSEQEHKSLPPTVLEMLSTAPIQHAPTVHIQCGGKRKQRLVVDPEFREVDTTNYDRQENDNTTDPGLTMSKEPTDPGTGTREDRGSAPQQEPDTPLTRHERATEMLKKRTRPVEVYNTLCSFKDKVQAVNGKWRLRAKHSKTVKRQRHLLRKQIQWEVQWAPTIMEGWEKDLAIDQLKYTPSLMRAATEEDLNQHQKLICEHCHETEQVQRCTDCKRGFHPRCQLTVPAAGGRCSQCYQVLQEPKESKRETYRQAVQQWYIEWQPQWEEEQQLRQLGYGEEVEHTIKTLEKPQNTPPLKEAKDSHLSNRDRQGNSGPRYHSTVGETQRKKCTFIVEDTDPHTDIVGTGQYEIQKRWVHRRHPQPNGTKKGYHKEMVTVHDPAGRTVGMICPDRAALLYRNYTKVMQERPEVVSTLNPQSFAEELASLLRRYKNGMKVPGSKRKVDLKNHWATPEGVYRALQKDIPALRQERFASPLNYHAGMQRYWSCYERDQLFGALHDAYSSQWTGLSVANPEYDSKEMYKAVSWAVHSAHITDQPTMTVFILPAWTEGSNTAYMKWVNKMPNTCRLLTTIPKRAFKFVPPQVNTMGMDPQDAGHPQWDINILLVGNAAGYTQSFGITPETSTAELKTTLIEAINDHSQPSPPLSWSQLKHHWPQEEPRHAPPKEELDPLLYKPPWKVKAAPTDSKIPWMLPYQPGSNPQSNSRTDDLPITEHPLKYDWTELAYTDGSQKTIPLGQEGQQTTVIGSGLYVPATNTAPEQLIGIRANSPGHNTAYRAELIGILGAFRQGNSRIMTDSVNSIHAIKATMHYPMRIRFHRHRNLLEEIRAAILALDEQAMLIKIRGHAGIPGNEMADDIAARVATMDMAEMDLSDVHSNDRPHGLWPGQREWEEDDSGIEKEKWRQVENLEDALTQRVQKTDIRLGNADTTTIYYSSMQRALPDISQAHMNSWNTLSGITEGMKCTRAKYLTGQLPTAKNLQRYKRKKTALCPCCKKHQDSGHHAIAWCPAIQPLVQEKHNAAVRIITKAIAQGDVGAHQIVYNDGGNAQKWANMGVQELHRKVSDIPNELISKEDFQACGSRPDIILFRRKQVQRDGGHNTTSPAEITLVEIKYVRDTDPARTARSPHEQHKKLYEQLRGRHPNATINRRIILLGVAGAVYNEHTVRQLEQLGVRSQHLNRTVLKLQRSAIQGLHTTWRQRQKLIHQRTTDGAPRADEVAAQRAPPVGGSGPVGPGDYRDEGGGAG
jgi:ribonuclease HI